MSALFATVVVLYVVIGVFTIVHLHVDLDMKAGHACLGGTLWPLILYRSIQNGYLTSFWKKFDEVTNRE